MKIVFFLLFSLPGLYAGAQYSRVIVQFTDKNGNPYSLATPQQYLSARAVERRSRYAIGLDSTDLPIVPRYIDSVKAQGAVTVLSQSKWLNQVLIRTSDSAALQKIRALPFVGSSQGVALRVRQDAEPGGNKLEPAPAPVLPQPGGQRVTADLYNYGSSYDQIHIHQGEYLHNKGFSGQGMIITVLDAGFNSYRTITAFDSIRLRGQVLGEKDFVAFDNSVNEDDAHGKNCLSIMAANWPGSMVGSAPWASFWLVRTEDAGSEYPVEEFNWAVGAEFADSCGSDVITSSLGYTTFNDAAFNHTYSQFYTNSTTVTKAAALAARKGMIVTNSAGNDGAAGWKYISFPADADSVCTIGAVNTANAIAAFSSYGYPGRQKPNIVSVGSGTTIAGTTAPTMGNGTSYSNPNIAGLVTCLWQAFPRFSNMKILSALYASSDKAAAPNDRFGYGLPNLKTAYRSLKTDENQLLYGNNWLWADPVSFIDTVAVHFVSQTDGNATLELLNSAQAVVATQNFPSEKQEVYGTVFTSLSSLPDGVYTVRYRDGTVTKTIQVQKAVILPLTGLQANAQWINRQVSINWSTLSESNTRFFHILRSTNGTDFTSLTTVQAAGVSQSPRSYAFTDTGAGSIQAKILFYQIVVVDKDNRKTASYTIRLLNRSFENKIVVFPNPAKGSVQVLMTSEQVQPAVIRLISRSGQAVREQHAAFAAGSNTVTINLLGIAAGDYIIEVQANGQTLQAKLVVH